MAARFSQLVSAIETRLADSTVSFGIGRLALKENAAVRRVVFVPDTVQHSYGHDVGGQVRGGYREPAVLTRVVGCEVHIWDGSEDSFADRFEATEELLHDIIVSIRTECMGRVRFNGEQWTTQTSGGADYAVNAEKVVLAITLEVPVIWESKGLTTITDEGVSVIYQGASGNETVYTKP